MNGRVFRRGNTWSYVVDVGANAHCERKQQMRGGFPTKREADKALRDLVTQVDNQRYVEPSKADAFSLCGEGMASLGRTTASARNDLVEL